MQRVLCIRTDRLGELVLTLPALYALKQSQAVHITIVAQTVHTDWLSHISWIDEVIAVDLKNKSIWKDFRSLRTALKNTTFDISFVANPSKAAHLLVWTKRIPIRFGQPQKWPQFLTHKLPKRADELSVHEVLYNMHFTNHFSQDSTVDWGLNWSADKFKDICTRLKIDIGKRIVAVHPWSSVEHKCWSLDQFKQCNLLISEKEKAQTVVIGGKEEAKKTQGMDFNELGSINACGKLSLLELFIFLSGVNMLITNDSGPMHVAAANNTPVIALFGSGKRGSTPQRWGPWGQQHKIIQREKMKEITPEMVLKAYEALI